jgi:hypothetical protein
MMMVGEEEPQFILFRGVARRVADGQLSPRFITLTNEGEGRLLRSFL